MLLKLSKDSPVLPKERWDWDEISSVRCNNLSVFYNFSFFRGEPHKKGIYFIIEFSKLLLHFNTEGN